MKFRFELCNDGDNISDLANDSAEITPPTAAANSKEAND